MDVLTLFALALSAITGSATPADSAASAKLCTVSVTIGGFLDGQTCNIPADSTVEVLTGYTQCHIPVTVDANCKITAADLDTCPFDDLVLDSRAGRNCR